MVRAGIIEPLINILRFGPVALQQQCLDILLFLLEDNEKTRHDIARAGLITEAVCIAQRPVPRRMTGTARASAFHLRIRACLALAGLGRDSLSRSKIAALGGIPALVKIMAESTATPIDKPATATNDDATTAAVTTFANRANAELLKSSRIAAVAALRAVCHHHAGNYQETLRALVMQSWILGDALTFDEKPAAGDSNF